MGDGSGKLDLMSDMFQNVELLEAVPQGAAWNGYFDYISVHSVAAAIVRSVVGRQDEAVRYLHSAGETMYPMAVVEELTEGIQVCRSRLCRWMSGWMPRRNKGLEQMLAAYMRSMGESSNLLAFPKLGKGQSV